MNDLKFYAFCAGVLGLYLLLLHTYWPFGDEQRHLNNFDSLVHGAVMPVALWLAAGRWPKEKK